MVYYTTRHHFRAVSSSICQVSRALGPGRHMHGIHTTVVFSQLSLYDFLLCDSIDRLAQTRLQFCQLWKRGLDHRENKRSIRMRVVLRNIPKYRYGPVCFCTSYGVRLLLITICPNNSLHKPSHQPERTLQHKVYCSTNFSLDYTYRIQPQGADPPPPSSTRSDGRYNY